jgi:hypothetical protein
MGWTDNLFAYVNPEMITPLTAAGLTLPRCLFDVADCLINRHIDSNVLLISFRPETWTAHRVISLRRVRGIHGYRSAEKNGLSGWQIRKLIKAGILNNEQIMPDAPHQIRAADPHK